MDIAIKKNLACDISSHVAFYQNVYPPDPDPLKNPPFFWDVTTVWPCAAAIWAAFGAHPGGGGGIDAGAYGVNRAPASNCPPTGGAAA